MAVVAARECDWSAASDSSWVKVSPSSGQGDATVQLLVSSNSQTSRRTAHVTVNGVVVDLSQDAAPPPPPPPPPTNDSPGPSSPNPGPTPAPAPAPPGTTPPSQASCAFDLSRTSDVFDANGGDGDVKVKARNGCAWEGKSNASWITVSAGSSGAGDGEVRYRVGQNSAGDERSGTLTIAGQGFSIRQRAAEVRTERVDFEGLVGSVSGDCPGLSMTVSGQTVKTDSSTRYKHGKCDQIRSGVKVKVKGTRAGTGPINADEVEIK